MVKYYECSKCGNKVLMIAQKDPIICHNCNVDLDVSDFGKIVLSNLFFEASSIQKMGDRWFIEIPSGLHANIRAMPVDLRTSKWKVHIESSRV